MQLAFHNEILTYTEFQELPIAEPSLNMIAWKVAALLVIVKLAACYIIIKRHRKTVPR